MKHISIRVPWHDNDWNGTVCSHPSLNTSCQMLRNISASKDSAAEEACAGKCWHMLSPRGKAPEGLPACKGENGSIMSPSPYKREVDHPYRWNSELPHSSLIPTEITLPPYSMSGVPFNYMSDNMRDEMSRMHPEFAPEEPKPDCLERSSWVYSGKRMEDILEWFRSNISGEGSLAVFYCKNGTPVDDDSRRLIVGIGEVTKVHPLQHYKSKADFTYPLWEIIMEHSIRPSLDDSNGFLLPYNRYLALTEEDIRKTTGKTKDEVLDEIKLTLDKLGNSGSILRQLSYGCDYVGNQNMLVILDKARKCIEKVIEHKLVGGNWKKQLRWIDEKIKSVRANMGPFPGFAEALRTLDIDYAYLIEQDLRSGGHCGVKDNPWHAFERLLNGGIEVSSAVYGSLLHDYAALWKSLGTEEKTALELLSRFEISSEVMKNWLVDKETRRKLIDNPYLISEESDAGDMNEVTPDIIDMGLCDDPEVMGEWLPEPPYKLKNDIDPRRIRAVTMARLKMQLENGDTLLSISEIEDYVKDYLSETSSSMLPYKYFLMNREFMEEKLSFIEKDDESKALQLQEYTEMEKFLSKFFSRNAVRKNAVFPVCWDSMKSSIKNYDPNNPKSVQAAQDQIEALKMFAERGLSVLTGGAGTGKTTIVETFLKEKAIANGGVLLLAPTGKARVRLAGMGNGIEALTIAQFLTRQKCFDWDTMTACVNRKSKKYAGAATVIIDECSMITTKDFYVLLNALDRTVVKRIILIGDPNQLPPIGAGRPFADLCCYLKDSKNADVKGAIKELRVVVRTIKGPDSDIQALASWFTADKPAKDADMLFNRMENESLGSDLRLYLWNDEKDLMQKLETVLEREILDEWDGAGAVALGDKIRRAIGLDDIRSAYSDPSVVERMQLLTPVKNPAWGTVALNQRFQVWLGNTPDGPKYNNISVPPHFIFYADKVIQLKNNGEAYNSKGEKTQLSNGQTGFVRYVENGGKKKGYCAKVSFSGHPGVSFNYYNAAGDDAEPAIDLAYAITIHKSQGSDFDTVIVVLPKSGRMLSRELVYTALTRAKKKLILLLEGSAGMLLEYSKPQMSELSRRNTNMFSYLVREEKDNKPFAEGLIHIAKNGMVVRSKSELIIVNELLDTDLEFEYEKELKDEATGKKYLPDFSFVDFDGRRIIWEHLGMLNVPSYRESWERKHEFYKSIGYVDGETLFITKDNEDGSFDSRDVVKVIRQLQDMM